MTRGNVVFRKPGYEPGQEMFSAGGPFTAGLFQTVSGAVPGATYLGYIGSASKYGPVDSGKKDKDIIFRTVGIDPYGGQDPNSPNIKWGSVASSDARWEWKDDPVGTPTRVTAVAMSDKITFFVKAWFDRGDNIAYVWFQDAAVVRDTSVPLQPVTTPTPTALPTPTVTPTPTPPPVPTSFPPTPPELRPSRDADYDLPAGLGHFFTQTDGQAGATGNGYVVTDLGDVPFWTYYKSVGGKEVVGYPVSDRFIWNGFVVQAFQKVVFQWRPEANTVYYVNVFDELSAQGKDAFLEAARSVPPPADTSPDTGLTWEQVVARHYAYLEADPDIKAAFFAESDPINLNGLPVAPIKQMGEVDVLRTQRKVFQKWQVDTPFARQGQVVTANGGDVGKEVGLYPPEATAAKPVGLALGLPIPIVGGGFRPPLLTSIPAGVLPPGVTVPAVSTDASPPPPPAAAATATPTPTATPLAPGFAFAQRGATTWEPNCGLTLIKGQIFRRDGTVFPGVTVKVWADGWDGAISLPAREGDGYWDVLLDDKHAKAGLWKVAVIKKETGELQSPTIQVETNTFDCAPGGSGKQVAKVDFQQQ